MRIIKNILYHLLFRKLTLAKWQWNIWAVFIFFFGAGFSLFIFTKEILLPNVFAATNPWTQTDWSGGTSSGVVTGTVTTYDSANSVNTSTSGQISLASVEEASNTDFETNLTGWAGGVAPNSISGLRFWYKADAISGLSDGANVSSWTDSSGNGYTATQNGATAVPIYKENILNGKPVVRFGTSAITSLVVASQTLSNRTQFAVVTKNGDPQGSYHSVILQMGAPYYQFYSPSGSSVMVYYPAGAINGDTFSGTQLLVGKTGPSGSVFYMNGVQKGTSGATGSSITDAFQIGSYTPGNYGLKGDIAEIIMFDSALSDADRKSIEAYLQAKYAVSSESVTITRDTGTKYAGLASLKAVAGTNGGNITQTINVGDTNNYLMSAYVYTDGSSVSSSDVELYYNNAVVSSTFTSVGSGWYRMTGNITGANANRLYGFQVKASKTVYVDNFSVNSYAVSGTLTSNIFDSEQLSAWGTLTYTSSGSTVSVKARTSNSSTMVGATDFASCNAITSGTDISSNNCVTDGHRYLQYQITLSTSDQTTTPTFSDISIGFSSFDTTAPTTNASSITMAVSSGGRSISSNGWNNATGPYFSFTAGSDNVGGSGLKGYCLYLGTDSAGNPSTAKGVLGTSPLSTTGSTCQFIISTTNVNLSTVGYLGSSLTDGSTYYLNIKAIDNGSNIFGGSSAQFQFRQDAAAPTNVSYVSAPSIVFGNIDDMNFSWPTSGGSAASDANSGVIGWQYSLDSGSTWRGPDTESTLGITYIEDDGSTSSHTLSDAADGSDIAEGINTVYLRTVDEAGNFSSGSTYRTAPLNFGGEAPSFAIACDLTSGITVTPSTSTSNLFALSWDSAAATGGNSVAGYYYMINTSPPSTLSTLESNSTSYIATSATSVSATKLTGSVKGTNTVYVVAYDDDDNYSQSNCIKGIYTLNSTLPDPVASLSVSDASIKSDELWRASLTWSEPSYKGTGTLTYIIQRSADNSSWSTVTTTAGTSYTDTVSTSTTYYYRVGVYDTTSESQAAPTYSTSVSVLPKGTWDSAPGLSSGPIVTGITTKKATINWSTSRASDTKVQYGISSGSYFNEEPSNSIQTTSHEIKLTNLSPGTTYYYKAKWTDEDGNTGISSEKTFSTGAAPVITDPKIDRLGLTNVIIQYTVKGASSVKFYYGKTTGFGATKEVSTSTSETTYTTTLEDLEDGTKYYYKINTFDGEGSEYESNILTFETLPRPRITDVKVQQVARTAQPSVLVTWTTNTEVSSIVTYYPQGNASEARDEVNVALKKGEHQMIVRGLFPQARYAMIIKGRDKAGNEAESDVQTFTTATDTRPPQITGLKVEGANTSQAVSGGQKQQQQLVVSWNTDEAATSQVEFGEGTGSTYSQRTQEDSNLAFNHVVVISGLSPSKVYHLRVLSKDKAGNSGNSIDTVTITPKSSDNALDLVITNLQQIFGFIGR